MMKTTKTHGILFGLAVMGATAVLGAVQPAEAQPEFIQVQYRRNYRYPRYTPRGRTYQTLTGRITRNYVGNGFLLITDRGSTYRVNVVGGEPRRLSVGDRVRVSGYYSGGAFRAQTFTMLRNR